MFKTKLLGLLPVVFIPVFVANAVSANTVSQSDATVETENPSETASQYMSDSTITAKVKSDLLANKDIKSLSISVTTNEGVVTLTGNVKNNMQKKKAVKIAEGVKGVHAVKDDLIITTK